MAESLSAHLQKIGARYPIDETLIFGLDVGIASIGSAVVRQDPSGGKIAFAGSRCFEAPEEAKTKELKNKTRRDKRLLRRVVRRRARRMADIRSLFVDNGLLQTDDPDAFHQRRRISVAKWKSETKTGEITCHSNKAPDPWQARADGLDRRLTDDEFAAALLHIAKHRGFKSNKKSDASQNAPDDSKKMLGAVAANRELLAQYGTVGRMVVNDAKFTERKRNKGGDYTHTFARDDLQDEVVKLFREQRRLGNAKATPELEERYIGIAFFQRPLQDSEDLVGICPFEPAEKRSPRHAPSYEKFRFLAKLNTIRLREADGSLRRLTAEELGRAVTDFGLAGKSVTWNAVAKKLGLPKGVFFDGIDEKKAKNDIAASKGCAAGTNMLYEALGPAGWNTVKHEPALLDAIAAAIAFREDNGRIEAALKILDDLEPLALGAIMAAVQRGDFGAFKGTGHISNKAARNILPHLLDAKVYSEACALAGYDHAQTRKVDIDDIGNPVVRRSLREALKQVETLVHHFGARPGRIVVELAREVGKSADERDQITRGIERRTTEKARHRADLKEKLNLGREPTEEELQRFELWKEQNYRCIYTDASISPMDLLTDAVQVDHVLPRSRSQDNGYQNRVLCFAKANQDKKQRTPWEWQGRTDRVWWDEFEARVRALSIKGFKKRNLLMRNFDEREQGFVERNLNDTKYVARALLSSLRDLYGEGEPDPAREGYLRTKRRLFARPGAVTALLRKAWGLNGIKDRADDRHHALDAIICAAGANESVLNSLTQQYQRIEAENRGKWVPPVPSPWPDFRDDAIRAYESVFVSRSEKRRGRGQGHKDTIYRIGTEDGRKITYERKAVADLTKTDLTRLKDADTGNRPLAAALADWIDRGKPADDLPRSPKGDPVRKVSLRRKGASGFDINGGHADNGDIVRVDVFTKPNGKGMNEFYIVPIYRHQVMDRKSWPEPPAQYVQRGKRADDWDNIGEGFGFKFSLYPDAYVCMISNKGEREEGYFRGIDISVAGINVSPHNLRDQQRKLGSKTARAISKFQIDRLGCKHPIERETRTWHGAACT